MVTRTRDTVRLERTLNDAYVRGLTARQRTGDPSSGVGENTAGLFFSEQFSVRGTHTVEEPQHPDLTALAGTLRAFAEQWLAHWDPAWSQHKTTIVGVLSSLPPDDCATEYVSLDAILPGTRIDWQRWHDLLDIRDKRKLTPDEEVEYGRMARVVSELDAEEEVAAAESLGSLLQTHEQVLASIERLTKAVQAAALQD